MRKTKVLAVVAAATLILAVAGGWASSTTQMRATNAVAPVSVQIDPLPLMANVKSLPAAHFADFSVVFPQK